MNWSRRLLEGWEQSYSRKVERDNQRDWGKNPDVLGQYAVFAFVVMLLKMFSNSFWTKHLQLFFWYIMDLAAEGSYLQGRAVISKSWPKKSLYSERVAVIGMMIFNCHTLNQYGLWFLRYLLTSKILPFVYYLEQVFFLGYHSWFIISSWTNRISTMAKHEEYASEQAGFYSECI